MRYLVTGATGFIGAEVTRQLVAAGHTVHAIVRTPAKAIGLVEQGVVVHAGDITDKESLRGPMRGVDGVFHIAGWYRIGARDDTEARRINVDGTRNVLELMRELAIPKGVYTSSIVVHGDTQGRLVDETYYRGGPWLSIYNRTKWEAHYLVADPMMRRGLPLVVVMPGVVYGPGDTSEIAATVRMFLRRQLPTLPGRTSFVWAHVEDVAAGHLAAMTQGVPGQCYHLTGPIVRFADALRLAGRVSGVPTPPLVTPPAVFAAAAPIAAILERFVRIPTAYSSESLRTIAGVTFLASFDKAKRDLGYAPRPFEEGWPPTIEHEMRALGIRRP